MTTLVLGDWLGFGFDPARLTNRDLWKYDALLTELDARIEAQPDDATARLYRGNAAAFRQGAAAVESEPGRSRGNGATGVDPRRLVARQRLCLGDGNTDRFVTVRETR